MWLDELADLVTSLRERIEKQQDLLHRNESATRYALVDPVLRALGWDLENPSDVVPEYSPGKGRADYGMMAGRGKARLIIEAKSLGTPTRQGIDQAITYCIAQGIEYFAVTNGELWEIYEPHRAVPIDEKLVASFDLRGREHETVMQMLWLWRGNFVEGEPHIPPPSNVAKRKPEPKLPSPQPAEEWTPLAELRPQSKQRPRPPQEIRFPGTMPRAIARWNHLQIRVVEWLVEQGRLHSDHCPVTTDRGRYIVHSRPERKSGKPFDTPRQVAGLWVDLCHNSEYHAYIARSILAARGVDPSTVHVRPRS